MIYLLHLIRLTLKYIIMAKKQVDLPDDLLETIKIEAIKAKIPANKFIVDILERHVKMKKDLKLEVTTDDEVIPANDEKETF